ncbi:MAG: calcium-translocating P-type ATPase, PMCA-type, partial [Christensenellales bacterium]
MQRQLKNFKGLTNNEAHKSRMKHGANELTKKKKQGLFLKFLTNFGDPIIKILLAALFINILISIKGESWFETVGIGIAIALATLVSTISEYGSEQTFQKLQQEAARIKCKVYRNNELTELFINEIVVGDHVLLQSGDRIPADGYILQGALDVDQSPLNGESEEVHKFGEGKLLNNMPKLDINNPEHVFRGSIICNGEGVMVVTVVGDKTYYGSIASQVQEETRVSPLKIRLSQLARTISTFGYISAVAVAIAYMFNVIFIKRGFTLQNILSYLSQSNMVFADFFQALLLAVVVIVMAVPEGLPMMITVVLSSNMKRMLKDNILVRKLVSIETSGSLNILFTDKTGTLTQGVLKVQTFISGENKRYDPQEQLSKKKFLWDILACSIFCNNEAMVMQKNGIIQPVGGNATDRALLSYALEYPVSIKNIDIIAKVPFSSTNKYSCSQVKGRYNLTFIKGAPEKILPFCTGYFDDNLQLHDFKPQEISLTINKLAQDAMRLIAVAVSDTPINTGASFKNLKLIGVLGIQDAMRPNAASGVSFVMSAGIQVVMITGDSADTATAIAREVRLIKTKKDIVLTSEQMNKMTDSDISDLLSNLRVVARAMPSDKFRLVRIAQRKGLVVGMTGDGINDAPALKKADVGFAMGSGTEIAKETGDIVILDNNLISIAKAVLYGRTIFKSIRKFIIFQLTVNLCAVSISIIGPFVGVQMPVTVMQMLWINLVIDTLAGLAFGGEPPLRYYMKERPKKRNEPIINKYMWSQICFSGIYTALIGLLFLKLPVFKTFFRYSPTNEYFLTAFFTFFLFAGLFNSLNARTHRINLMANIRGNKTFIKIMGLVVVMQIIFIYLGGEIFRTSGLTFFEFLVSITLAFTVVPVDMLRKMI